MDRSISLDFRSGIIQDRRTSGTIGVLFFVIAIVLGAYVRLPIKGSPVPITLQTFFVLLSGAVLGKRLGAVSQVLYMAIGIMGVPVFQGYSFGIFHLCGPTGGYIVGFAAASFVVGYIAEKVSLRKYSIIPVFLAGNFIIYSFGALWLMYSCNINLSQVIRIGVLPFLPGDLVKIVLASIIYLKISKRARQIFTL